MSSELYDYAARWEHYSIDGKNSLHDAWLVTAKFAYREKQLVLEFLGPQHDRKLSFEYLGVSLYAFDLNVQFKQGDGDVLTHEFRVEHEIVTHEIAFLNGRTITVKAQNVIPSTDMIEVTQPNYNR